MVIVLLMYSIPFIAYFGVASFTKPHDCFECFNRIPTLKYSIYQYTSYERNLMREERVGQGAVKRFNDMIKQAKIDSDKDYT